MKLHLTLSIAALCVTMSVSAQKFINGRGCGTQLPPAGWDEAFNKQVEQHRQNLKTGKTVDAAYTIPVVVHVIYGTQAIGTFPNISKAQINSQIAVMNADYAGTGYNVNNMAATAFSAVGAADCHITFCLAQIDPEGDTLSEPGIDRIKYSTLGTGANPNSFSSQSTFQSYIDGTVKPNTIWDPTAYFNIWITDVNSNVGLLGYSTFPASSTLVGLVGSNSTMQNDGIWVWTKAFGNTGTLEVPYNRGRTATHESGHYFGLRHIGGDGQTNGTGSGLSSGDCSATDYCNDTPPQKGGYDGGQYGQNYGAPTYPLHLNDCSASDNGDMFMNFMDYTDDAICTMFTPDQLVRIQTSLENSPYRTNLTASSATMCNIPAFSIPSVGCVDTTMQADNTSIGAVSYSWTSNPATGVTFSPSATSDSPIIIFANSGTYSIIMTTTSSAGTSTANTTNKVLVSNCTSAITGIAKNSALTGNITLAPNPSSGIVNVITSLSSGQNLEITVHNTLGQVIISSKYTNVTANMFSLDLNNYPNGVYSVTISSNSDKVVKRLILSK